MFKNVTFKVPAYLLIIMNILGFGWLFLSNNYNVNIAYIGLGLLSLMVIIYTVIVLCRMGDKFILLIANMLVTFGVLLLCRLDINIGVRQIVWIVIGGSVFFVSYWLYRHIQFLNKMWFIYFAAGVFLFLLTLIFGRTVNGSRNWLAIAGVVFQPAEIIKMLYIMALACYFSGSQNRNLFDKIKPKYANALMTYIFIGFLVLQRDWGTILVFFSVYILMLYVYEDNFKFLFTNIGLASIVGILGYKFLHHIQVRVKTWIDPWADISNTGYQITQSLFAIGAGGYFGRGLGNGSPSYIPEVHSDFIFAAVCEEMGVFGGGAIIILYLLLVYRCFKIAYNAKNPFNKAVGLGVSLVFAIQTFIIVGGVIKFIPLTGITLPFVSYGGTSVVVSFAILGIIQAISAKEQSAVLGRISDED